MLIESSKIYDSSYWLACTFITVKLLADHFVAYPLGTHATIYCWMNVRSDVQITSANVQKVIHSTSVRR